LFTTLALEISELDKYENIASTVVLVCGGTPLPKKDETSFSTPGESFLLFRDDCGSKATRIADV
jgi:hypothetical protein